MSLQKVVQNRSKILRNIRNFFTKQGFLEVETPIMVQIPGMEPHLTPFETALKINKNTTPLYLHTSPELQMKKLLAAGFGNIFQITKTFRNGELGGPLHNPEFTMLEWYREKSDYKDLMEDSEKLIIDLIKNMRLYQLKPSSKNKKLTIKYQNYNINFAPPWPRQSINELFQNYCKIDLLKNKDFHTFKETCKEMNYDTNSCQNWDDIFFKIFLNHIEPNLPKNSPIFIYDYPSSQAALAKKSAQNPFFAQRFELYIAGIEIANAFSELIDPKEQRQRLEEEQNLRKKLKKTVFPIDEEFLTALSKIKHPCAGIAMGIDRLIMLLLNKTTIDDVLLFPMKPTITNL